ncbi:hypothetical protein JBE38_14295 [Pseudomonas sp. ICBG1301]|uniref:hypothetical protein n=1 Tax=Pseudomonas sp. ICBG1301 TaxID=2795987 RepID=UPI001963E3F2|nr:hypothetical protein [Pseudomonas sp. ICBG1301]MBM9487098.1 hypothetical protein [Pseudomonas sp. ICBG1301]
MTANKNNKNADFRVSLSTHTEVNTPGAATFISRTIDLHSPFGHYDVLISQNPGSTQSNRRLGLSFNRNIQPGVYPANGSGGQFHALKYTVSTGTPALEQLIEYTADTGNVFVSTLHNGAFEHFEFTFDGTVTNAAGETHPLSGRSVIYVKHYL